MNNDETIKEKNIMIKQQPEYVRRYMLLNDMAKLINKYGIDNDLNIPDFIVAKHLFKTLETLSMTVEQYEEWHDYRGERNWKLKE